MNIGFVGFGEASSNILFGLSNEKFDDVYYAYDLNNEVFKDLNINVNNCNTIKELIEKVDCIFVAVPGKNDEEVFKEIVLNDLKNKLFMDISTSSPKIKNRVSSLVEEKQGQYVDVAVLGSVPKLLHKTPMAISGNGVSMMVDAFSKYHMNLTVTNGQAGKASTIKLCRSIFMKGLPALAIETKKACDEYGVTEEVFSSIYKNLEDQTFENYLNILINGAYKHSVRQRDELLECVDLEKNANIDQNMTKASIEVFNSLIYDNKNK